MCGQGLKEMQSAGAPFVFFLVGLLGTFLADAMHILRSPEMHLGAEASLAN
jgi:hypothetical protein